MVVEVVEVVEMVLVLEMDHKLLEREYQVLVVEGAEVHSQQVLQLVLGEMVLLF